MKWFHWCIFSLLSAEDKSTGQAKNVTIKKYASFKLASNETVPSTVFQETSGT